MKGSIFKRCGCTEMVDGRRKQLGARCPKLRRKDGSWNPRHGTWYFQLGKRPVGGFGSGDDAQRALDSARDRVRRGGMVADPLVSEQLRGWIASKVDIARTTHHGYELHIEKHLIPRLGHLRLSEMRVAHVAEALLDVPGADANRQRVRATLRSALSDALREGLVLVNVASLVKLPAGRRPKAAVWTVEREATWRKAVETLKATDATGAALVALEKAAMPPSAVMVWRPTS